MTTSGNDLVDSYEGSSSANFRGLTKMEYFAALAMQGIEASNPIDDNLTAKEVADRAVQLASALIEALNRF